MNDFNEKRTDFETGNQNPQETPLGAEAPPPEADAPEFAGAEEPAPIAQEAEDKRENAEAFPHDQSFQEAEEPVSQEPDSHEPAPQDFAPAEPPIDQTQQYYPPYYPPQQQNGYQYPPRQGYQYGQPPQQNYPHPGQYQRHYYNNQPNPYYNPQQYDPSKHVHPGFSTADKMPKSPPKEPTPPNKGLRVFAAMLALVVVATGFTTAGYFAGKNKMTSPLPTASTPAGGNSNGLNIDIVERGAPNTEENKQAVNTNQAASKVAESVVGIVVYSLTHPQAGSEATGVVLNEDGYILTNDHIYSEVPNAKFLIIMSDKKEYQADFVAGDSRSDLAVLKVKDPKGLKPATFGNSDELAVGENVIAVGNPYGMAYAGTVTKGIVSAVNRRVSGNAGSYSMKCIQTDTAINPGNSGGPLVNLEGQVVGINSSKIVASGYEGIGFAIPSQTAVRVVDSLVRHGYVAERSKLGISYQVISTVLSIQNNMPAGLYIHEITQESDINGKGVSKGDIITKIGDVEIKNGEEILDVIESTKPGESIEITVYHATSKQESKLFVKLLADKGSSSYKIVDQIESSKNPLS